MPEDNQTGSSGRREHSAQNVAEYAVIMAAVAVLAMATWTSLGSTIVRLVNKVIACL